MFTGIIQTQGRIVNLSRAAQNIELTISAADLVAELSPGDSVAINGVCLTAEAILKSDYTFIATAVSETMSRTNLSKLQRNDRVNLELSLRPSDRLGGHFLQGHVDALGACVEVRETRGSWLIRFSYPAEYGRYIVEKGSIAVDGISLTAFDVQSDHFTVSIVPHTFRNTTLGGIRAGHKVNLEFDLIGKYIAKQYTLSNETLTLEKLQEYGY